MTELHDNVAIDVAQTTAIEHLAVKLANVDTTPVKVDCAELHHAWQC